MGRCIDEDWKIHCGTMAIHFTVSYQVPLVQMGRMWNMEAHRKVRKTQNAPKYVPYTIV